MKPYITVDDLQVADRLPSLAKEPVTKKQLVRYAGASGDFNPIHTDDEASRKAGLKGVIAQGPLVMGFMGQAITTWFPKKYLKRFKVRFIGMTFPGDVITIDAVVAEKEVRNGTTHMAFDATAKDRNGDIKLMGRFEIVKPSLKGE